MHLICENESNCMEKPLEVSMDIRLNIDDYMLYTCVLRYSYSCYTCGHHQKSARGMRHRKPQAGQCLQEWYLNTIAAHGVPACTLN